MNMCWNADVSLQTWIFGLIGFVVGLLSGFPIRKLLFAIVFSSMQLVEYFLWKNIEDPVKNRFYSKIGHFVLLLEPLFALLMIQNRQQMLFLMTFYLLFLIIYHFFFFHQMDFRTTIGQNGHLDWKFTRNLRFPYGLIWFSLFFYGILMSGDIVFILGGLITILIALFQEKGKNTFTSLWCYYSNIVWIYILLWSLYKGFSLKK